MLPESNAPAEMQPWVRDVSNRAYSAAHAAGITERNAYSYSGAAKAAYELIDDRIANINTFTNGLFEQGVYTNSVTTYSQLTALPVLYQYTDGDYQEYASIVQRVPFARYNELTVTADSQFASFTTDASVTGISVVRPLRPMIAATIPPLPWRRGDGSYTDNGTSYASRWTVENFEPFVNYNIPGNVVPVAYSATYGQSPPGMHPNNGTTQIRYSRDGYTSYSMKYTRQWLMDYLQAIADYTMANNPPSSGYYMAPDVNQVQIVLGYFFRDWQGPATNALTIDDPRLNFTMSSTFVLEGVKNLGY